MAREAGTRFFNTGFAHSKISANCVWAISKALGGDAWIGTLKSRLGLPDHILSTLPDEEEIVGDAFRFEKEHPELFDGELLARVGVYFSYETRNHTMFGSLFSGYCEDYNETLALLYRNAICAHTLFCFPEDASRYAVVLLSSAVKMTEDELASLYKYLAAGGAAIVTGPSAIAGCGSGYVLPSKADVPAADLFPSVPDGVHLRSPDWLKMRLPVFSGADEWSSPRKGLYYHPGRASEGINHEELVLLCNSFLKPEPVEVQPAKGFMTTVFENKQFFTVHLLAEEYDVDIDHELDAIRTHHSRVNIITKAEPMGIDREIKIKTVLPMTAYAPFCDDKPTITHVQDGYTVQLPDHCAYAILRFVKPEQGT